MKVVYTYRALEGRKQVAAYIRREFGVKALQTFNRKTKEAIVSIRSNPESHPIDWDLSDNNLIVHLYIINGLSKLVYVIKEKNVVIVDFWDTRHEPPKSVSLK